MLSMPQDAVARAEQLKALGERAVATFDKRNESLGSISENNPSRFSVSLYGESAVHLSATMATFSDLHRDLGIWLAASKVEQSERQKVIDDLGWDLALHALENCVQVAGVSHIEEVLKVSRVIVDRAATLFGAEYFRLTVDFMTAIQDGWEVWKIQHSETRTAKKVLAELELFMVTSLTANQYAVAQVHALTQQAAHDFSETSLQAGGKVILDAARKFVVEKVKKARLDLAGRGGSLWVRFPEDGFWIDAPTI